MGKAFVLDLDHFLADTGQAAQPKFFEQAPLVDGFDKARSLVPVNFDSRSDDRSC